MKFELKEGAFEAPDLDLDQENITRPRTDMWGLFFIFGVPPERACIIRRAEKRGLK